MRVVRFETIDSTNRYLLDEARRGAGEGLVAVAEEQTAGRGRRGRSWIAPAGASLLVSVLLRPELPAERTQLVTMASSLAMADAVAEEAGFEPELKWPNDLVVADCKLAGVLSEADVSADGEVRAVVVGIGLNVNWRGIPDELAGIATACNLVAGRDVDRELVLGRFLAGLAARRSSLEQVATEYAARLATLGRRVRVERPDGDLVGTAVGVGPAGELRVEAVDGEVVDVHAGDVVHLRDA